MEQAPQGSGHGTKLDGAQEVSSSIRLSFGWSCVEPGAGVDDPSNLGYSMIL